MLRYIFKMKYNSIIKVYSNLAYQVQKEFCYKNCKSWKHTRNAKNAIQWISPGVKVPYFISLPVAFARERYFAYRCFSVVFLHTWFKLNEYLALPMKRRRLFWRQKNFRYSIKDDMCVVTFVSNMGTVRELDLNGEKTIATLKYRWIIVCVFLCLRSFV